MENTLDVTKFKFLPVGMATEYYAQMNGDVYYTTNYLDLNIWAATAAAHGTWMPSI